jgi:formate-dependent nitrite reductase membrane component NrfD
VSGIGPGDLATLPRGDRARGRYSRPVIKQPVWKPEIPFYFYTGGLAGASAGLAALSELTGNEELARRAWGAALFGGVTSPLLLISDLGKPRRFLNMLRMFKVTSPMSLGSWILSAFGSATGVAAIDAWLRPLPVPLAAGAKASAALLGLPLTTYTAALIANTAVPVWHEARAELPFVFAAGGAASAGAAAMALTPVKHAAPARRLAVAGAAIEVAAVEVMRRRLPGRVGRPYHEGRAHALGRVASALTGTGAVVAVAAGKRRRGAIAAGALITTGAVLERWSVFTAGSQSAADPQATTGPQRERLDARAPSAVGLA